MNCGVAFRKRLLIPPPHLFCMCVCINLHVEKPTLLQSYTQTHIRRKSFFVPVFFILISLFDIIDFCLLFPFVDLHTCIHICTFGECEKTHFSYEAPDAMLIAFTLYKHRHIHMYKYMCDESYVD